MDIFTNTFLSDFVFKRKDLLLDIGAPTAEYLTKRINKIQDLDRNVWSHVSDLMRRINPSERGYVNNNGILETLVDQNLVDKSEDLIELLKNLIPWRKGPWRINGIDIDAEWRSNIKYQELNTVIPYFKNSSILDIGGGNGYYSFRALLDGADSAVCLDPSEKFLYQFELFQKFASTPSVHFELAGLEDVPSMGFEADVVLCMGILYHHRDPLGVLSSCSAGLKPGGLLVLESMTIEDDRSICLFPEDRYAMARNVYFLPSTTAMVSLCKRAGFLEVDVISDRPTTLDEQRTTEWMPFKSLKEFLDPDDIKKTVEGYPAPKRTIVVCKKRG